MHMVVFVFRTTLEEAVLKLLEGEQVLYTRLEKVRGKGVTGIAPGSITYGGANTIIWTAVSDERITKLQTKVEQFKTELSVRRKVTPPFHAFMLPCVQWC